MTTATIKKKFDPTILKNKLKDFNKLVTSINGGVFMSIFSFKGGIGKTNISLHLAGGLAYMGLTVLVIDLDRQGDSGNYFGINVLNKDNTLYEVLLHDLSLQKAISKITVSIKDEFDSKVPLRFLYSNNKLDQLNNKLISEEISFDYLKNKLEPLKKHFDVIIFDCPPKPDKVHDAAFYISNEILIPSEMEKLSIGKINVTKKYIDEINNENGSNANILGVVPCKYEKTRLNIQLRKELVESGEETIFTSIRDTVKIKEAPSVNKLIYGHDFKHKASDDYFKLSYQIGKYLFEKYKRKK
jgi:chromosome partitioning protein